MLKKLFTDQKREEGTFVAVRKHTVSARRTTVLMLLTLTALLGWLYVFFGSGIFRVKTIDVDDLTYLDRGEVIAETFKAMDEQGTWPWQWRNILLLDDNALGNALETKLYAENVAVEKFYPDVLRLKIKERQTSVIVVSNNELYLIDHHGIGAKRITNEDEAAILQRIEKPSPATKADLPILTINSGISFVESETVVDEEAVQQWLNAFHELSQAGFGYRNALLEASTSTKLILNLFEPYDVYFDLLTPMNPQIEGFYAFMRSKTPQMKITEYVDARVPGRIYYK